MDAIKFRIVGTSTLLVTQTAGLNPFNVFRQRLAALTAKKKKTLDDHRAIQRAEWDLALSESFADDIGPYMPAWNVRCAIRNQARAQKMGPAIQKGLHLRAERFPLEYDGPREPDAMWSDPAGRFVDRRGVKNMGSGGAVLRTRACFPEWALACQFDFDASLMDRKQLRSIIEDAGRYEGLGQYRERFGKFVVEW